MNNTINVGNKQNKIVLLEIAIMFFSSVYYGTSILLADLRSCSWA